MSERWLPVVGYEGLYQVSDLGNVKSRYRTLKRSLTARGYFAVGLYRKNVMTNRFVHVLVLEAFVGPKPPGMQCCHGNNLRNDNRLWNLRWDTSKANQADRIAHGTMLAGESAPNAKLTNAQAQEIRREYKHGNGCALARQFGVSQTTVWHIVQGKIYV